MIQLAFKRFAIEQHIQVPKTVRRFGNIPQDAQIFIMNFERTTIRLSVALTRTAFDGFGGRF